MSTQARSEKGQQQGALELGKESDTIEQGCRQVPHTVGGCQTGSGHTVAPCVCPLRWTMGEW